MPAELAEQVARLHHVESVMERLGLGRSKVFELIASRRLRSVKVGRRRLVSEAALVEFIESLDGGSGDGPA
jgi:excisionase family DNA binding protein